MQAENGEAEPAALAFDDLIPKPKPKGPVAAWFIASNQGNTAPANPAPSPAAFLMVRVVRTLPALVIVGVALAVAWFGLQINAWYGSTLGKTSEAGALFSGLSIAADLLALFMPAVGGALWHRGDRAASCAAWAVWSLTFSFTLLASVGFASLNISDTSASRTAVADERAGLVETVERLRRERSEITEVRSVGLIETALQTAQPGARLAWVATKGCRDVTLPESLAACAPVLALRQAVEMARRRDAIDLEFKTTQARLTALPPIRTGDPQAAEAARLLNWLSGGLASVTANDVATARVLTMTALPQTSGLVFMLGLILLRREWRRTAT